MLEKPVRVDSAQRWISWLRISFSDDVVDDEGSNPSLLFILFKKTFSFCKKSTSVWYNSTIRNGNNPNTRNSNEAFQVRRR
jgi:hypothetical protein